MLPDDKEIIEYGLNKLKNFEKKEESALLKNLSVPSDSNTELTKKQVNIKKIYKKIYMRRYQLN